MPERIDLSAVYVEDYYESFRATHGIVGGDQAVSAFLASRLLRIEAQVGVGHLVDLGCAEGHFVAHARSRGWNAVGVEPSQWAARAARRRYGVTVFNSDLADAPIEPGSVDVIHANHVIEHLVDPIGTLRVARRLLRRGGLLVLEVPYELRAPLADRLFQLAKRQPQAPAESSYHLFFFSPRGLQLAVEGAGFEAVKMSTVRYSPPPESRLPFGAHAKRALFAIERRLMAGPNLEVVAAATGRQ